MTAGPEIEPDRNLPSAGPWPAPEGTMERLVAEHDWANSPLGPREEWPRSLEIALGICLASRHPMVIWWGPELVLLYNDGWIPILGPSKHPALGQRGIDVWPEIWDVIGRQLNGVLQSGEATWSEDGLLMVDRYGYTEEAYFTYSYSAIHDETGRVAGIFTAVTETTEKVVGARRMATLRDLGEVSATGQENVLQACSAIIEVLGANRYDLPAATIYLLDGTEAADLIDGYGIRNGSGFMPQRVVRGDGRRIWSILDSLKTTVLDDIGERWPAEDFDPHPLGQTMEKMVAVPMMAAGTNTPIGLLGAGVSPYCALNDEYLGFIELVAGHVANAINDTSAYELERRRAEALAELDRAKTEFFSNVSHELRTPLTLILGPVEDSLLDDEHPLDSIQRGRIELVRRNAGRLRRLVNDMLDFSRIEAGRLQANPVPTALATFTQTLVQSFAPAIQRSGLTLETDIEPLERPVLVDRDMWEKVVLNLLSNALKYTLDGGISVRLRHAEGEILLEVTDTGIGIPLEDHPRLFERFYRVRSTTGRSHEGSGIGLALVSELLKLNDGSIEVESRPHVGSTFRVRLPVRTAVSGSAAEEEAAASGLVGSFVEEALGWLPDADQEMLEILAQPLRLQQDASTVLIVDDNADLRNMLVRLLANRWRVLVAKDGQEALELVERTPPDLILSDVMMPRVDGFELIRRLRANPETATIPVIFLSARAGQDSAVEGLDAGADDYLVKPFSSRELIARVRSNLELARLRNRESSWWTAVSEAISDGLFTADRDGVVVELNPAFARITGYEQSGAPYALPHPWWPEAEPYEADGGHHRRELTALFAKRGGTYTGPLRHRDGHRVWVTMRLDAVEDPRSGQEMLIGATQDLTATMSSVERLGPLAQMTSRLAQARSTEEVLNCGLADLREVFPLAEVDLLELSPEIANLEPHGPEAAAAEVQPGDVELIARLRSGRQLAFSFADTEDKREALAGHEARGVHRVAARVDEHLAIRLAWARAHTISADEQSLLLVLCEAIGQARARAALTDEQTEIAQTLQRSILSPTSHDLPHGVAAVYLPAAPPLQVGGDWYDVVEMPDGSLALIVGDCVGHGLKAASVMGQLRSAAAGLILQNRSPEIVLEELDLIAQRIEGAACTTVFCAILNPDRSEIKYASAGHPPGLILHLGGGTGLLDEATTLPLAIGGIRRRCASALITPGDSVVLFTDGLVERRREPLNLSIERLRETLSDLAGGSPQEVADEAVTRLGAGERQDDVALLIYTLSPDWRCFSRTLAPDPGALAPLRRDLRRWFGNDVSREDVDATLLAITEATANAFEHAQEFPYGGRVGIRVELDSDSLAVTVDNPGMWKAPDSLQTGRGRGLRLINAFMTDLTLTTSSRGTTLRAHRELAK